MREADKVEIDFFFHDFYFRAERCLCLRRKSEVSNNFGIIILFYFSIALVVF